VLFLLKTPARRTVLLASLFLSGLAGTLSAADRRSWVADGDDGASWIIYGTPESDDVLLSLTCDKAAKTLTVWFATEPVAVKNPKTLPLEISSEGGHVSLTGNGNRSEMDDAYSLEATAPMTPEFEKLLTGARKISVKAEGAGKADMPLDDIAVNGAQDVVKGCR
jgi:hypothetical protein